MFLVPDERRRASFQEDTMQGRKPDVTERYSFKVEAPSIKSINAGAILVFSRHRDPAFSTLFYHEIKQ